MGKIAIVGVKGSGKTVLMTALGEKYQVADPFGLVLSPESPDAFGFVRVNMAKMRGGEWPMETPHDSVRAMRWSLQRERADGPNEVFCDLDFLDFGGEIYTEAFGSGPRANSGMWESECAALKAHIGESQMLVVLVNLRDVVSGATDPDTLTALWVTKGMLDYASRDLKLANLAIAFTQVDAYRDVIAASGGLKAVLRKCMPHVYSSYRDLPLFALSAVDRTVEGEDGLPRPAPGFGSQGLDDLVHWILGCTEKGRACADEIAATKARPHELWRGIVAGMEALRADAAQPAGFSAAERCAKIAGLQTAAAELTVSALRHDVPDFTDEGLVERRTELGSWAKLAGLAGEYVRAAAAKDAGLATRLESGLVAEAAAWPHLLARAREEARQVSAARKSRFRARTIGVAALLVSAILGIGVAAVRHNADVDRLVAEKGYSCESSFGIRNAVWKAGVRHPRNVDLISDCKPEIWKSARRFYRWKPGTSKLAWEAGLVHPENRDLVSDATPETWRCTKAGYRWKRGTLEIEWCGGLAHPDNQWLVSTDMPGTWKCTKPGYRWKRGTSQIDWVAGCTHPTCPDLKASNLPDKWICTKAGYRWDGQRGIVARNGETLTATVNGIELFFAITNGQAAVVGSSLGEKECGEVVIPRTIDGCPVTVIGKDAFRCRKKLMTVTIPEGVTSIGDYAFWLCGLKSVTIPNGVTSIGKHAFESCLELGSVVIPPSVTSIDDGAFSGCNQLTTVTLPQGVKSIGFQSFSCCFNLTAVTLPEGLTHIGESAFSSCRLTSVTIPSSVTHIGESAFSDCRLTSVTILPGVKSIGSRAFEWCCKGQPLMSVTIPSSVTSIAEDAFRRRKVRTVYSDNPERAKVLMRGVDGIYGDVTFVKSK